MKILQINNYHFRKGGAESVYLNTGELLEQKGHEVIYFSSLDSNLSPSNINRYFVQTGKKSRSISNLYKSLYSTEAANNLQKLIEENSPEVAHFHNIHGVITFSILPVLKKMNIPVVTSMHGFKYLCPAYVFINGRGEICEECKGGKYYKCLTNNCSAEGRYKSFILSINSYLHDFFIPYDKYIDQYIFVSKFTLNKFVEFNPQIKNKANQVYNFNNRLPEKTEACYNGYYLYIGRLEREKGLFTLLDAFKNFQDKKLVIAGDGSLAEKLKIYDLPNVELVGYKKGSELEGLIKGASFVVVPSECYENNPMAIVESFSFGKPVIGSRLGGITELVENQNNGYLFEAKNSTDLLKVLKKSSSIDKKEYDALSNNAYHFALENFNKERFYSELINIYLKSINSLVKKQK